MSKKDFLAIGLMSGTSMDGVDAALVTSDGHYVKPFGTAVHLAYDNDMRENIAGGIERAYALGRPTKRDDYLNDLIAKLTDLHGQTVKNLLRKNNLSNSQIDVVGFHGQTLLHRPEECWSWQIGDGQRLANLINIPVVNDFRSNDLKKGGQGAPLVPLYHQALLSEMPDEIFPIAVINIGGVSNITWIGGREEGRMLAFDCGPGNALLDDWVKSHTGEPMDRDGIISASGMVNHDLLDHWLEADYFYKMPPKSLDRMSFSIEGIENLTLKDGAATLLGFTARVIEIALSHCPDQPKHIYICGGGSHNRTLMSRLGELDIPVEKVEKLGWKGDYVEAEAFAYLACRSLKKLPITFPGTTGVLHSSPGGALYHPQ